MPLPDEDLAQLRSAGPAVTFDRRRTSRGEGAGGHAPAWLADVSIDRRSAPRAAPAAELPAPGAAQLLTPLKNAARKLEPAFVAARAVGERLHRHRLDPAQLLAEGELLEAEGELRSAFAAYGGALLAAPLDATPVRALERLATEQQLRLALADLYERVVEAAADHPSAPTLQRRAAQLRLLAEERGDAGLTWAEVSASAGATERARPVVRAVAEAPRRSDEQVDGVPASPPPRQDEAQKAPLRLAEAAALGHVLAKWKLPKKIEAPASPPEIDRVPASDLAPGAPVAAAPVPAPAGDRNANIASLLEAELARTDRRASAADDWDGELSARTVPLAGEPEEPTAPSIPARLLAWAIDGAVVLAVPLAALGAATLGFARPGVSWIDQAVHLATQSRSALAASLFLGLLTAFVYLTLGATFGGRTLGGRVAGLRSVALDHGGSPDFATAALRSAVAIAGTLALLAGPLWAFVDPMGQALHDKVARTRTLRC